MGALLELRFAHTVLRRKITCELPERAIMLPDQLLWIHYQRNVHLGLHDLPDLADIIEYKIV